MRIFLDRRYCLRLISALPSFIVLSCSTPSHVVAKATRIGELNSFSRTVASETVAALTDTPPEVGMQAAKDRLHEAEQRFNRLGATRMASPGGNRNWSDEIVYQVMVDRFNDGDRSNNELNIEDNQRKNQSGSQRGLSKYRHGGDLKGITQRLDYLQHLGITSLWITPFLQSNGAYHGYCTQDPTQIDPGFGTHEDFQELVQQAHRRGMRVIMDVVVNHLCDNTTHYDDQRTPFNSDYYDLCLSDLSSKEWRGVPEKTRGQRDLVFGPTFFKPLANRNYFNRCGYRPGDATSSGPAAIFGDFSGQMFDFNTMNWDFQKIFTEFYKAWIAEADVDGFRLDAAKHVTPDFVARFSTEVRDYARKLGKKDFFVIGEVADNTEVQAQYLGKMKTHYPPNENAVPAATRSVLPVIEETYKQNQQFPYPGLNAIYDFTHSGALENVFLGNRSLRALKSYFWSGNEFDASIPGGEIGSLLTNEPDKGRGNANWNLIEIHDWTRFLAFDKNEKKFRTALGYLLTTSGVPIIYYGMEQGLDGECNFDRTSVNDPTTRKELDDICKSTEFSNDSRSRQDMFVGGPWRLGSVVPEINALAGIGVGTSARQNSGASEQQDPYANTGHDLFQYVRKLIAIRKSCDALSHGKIYFRAANDTPEGLLAFSRIIDGHEALVVINSSQEDIEVAYLTLDSSINANRNSTYYQNLFNLGEKAQVIRNSDGATFGAFDRANSGRPFVAKSRSVAVFIHESEIGNFDHDLQAATCR